MGDLMDLLIAQHVVNAVAAMMDVWEQEALENAHAKVKPANRHRNRGYALNEVSLLSNCDFAKMFRMSRNGFENLLTEISPFMHDTDELKAIASSGSLISKRTKLYVTLRFLAGGSFLDLVFAWGISKSAFFSSEPEYGVVWPTLEAIDRAFKIGLPVNDEAKLQEMADEFSTYTNGLLSGCVTAIDGWVARTRKPNSDEVDDIMSYRNRHECWGLVVLAGCDARCNFTMLLVTTYYYYSSNACHFHQLFSRFPLSAK
jgi:hypothetical protein